MGKIIAETKPASTMMIAITVAKIGRSIKNRDIIYLSIHAGDSSDVHCSYCFVAVVESAGLFAVVPLASEAFVASAFAGGGAPGP